LEALNNVGQDKYNTWAAGINALNLGFHTLWTDIEDEFAVVAKDILAAAAAQEED